MQELTNNSTYSIYGTFSAAEFKGAAMTGQLLVWIDEDGDIGLSFGDRLGAGPNRQFFSKADLEDLHEFLGEVLDNLDANTDED